MFYLIYVNFACSLKAVETYEGFYSKKFQVHDPCSFAYIVVCIDHKFTKPVAVVRGKNAAYEFIKAVLKSVNTLKK